MSFDNEPSSKDMIYLNFRELIANQLHFILLKCEVKFEEWFTKFHFL